MNVSVAIEKRLRSTRREFALDVRFDSDADVTILFGPSGAGKTLTLLAMAGLVRPDSGAIRCGDRVLFDSARGIDVPARLRRIGFVFQDYALFPHLSVAQNVAFARGRGWIARRGAATAVAGLLETFDLGGCRHALPAQLSGGQRQRVALARALAAEPELLLLDEPFAALDAPLRSRLRGELLALQRKRGLPIVVITHDPDDVAALGGRVIGLVDGRVTAAEQTAASEHKP
jgi:molybdate transport system ATP-binding protein